MMCYTDLMFYLLVVFLLSLNQATFPTPISDDFVATRSLFLSIIRIHKVALKTVLSSVSNLCMGGIDVLHSFYQRNAHDIDNP